MKNNKPGTCWFLENRNSRIYNRRFSACRIYPHMLRRNADETGRVTWKKFAHQKEHGCFDAHISDEKCLGLAREIKEYENAFLTYQISFLETIHEYFTVKNLRNDQEMYDYQMQRFLDNEPVDSLVFYAGELEKYRITKVN